MRRCPARPVAGAACCDAGVFGRDGWADATDVTDVTGRDRWAEVAGCDPGHRSDRDAFA